MENIDLLKEKIIELKDWGKRQKSVLEDIKIFGFKNVIDSVEPFKDWLEAELYHFMDLIDNLEI